MKSFNCQIFSPFSGAAGICHFWYHLEVFMDADESGDKGSEEVISSSPMKSESLGDSRSSFKNFVAKRKNSLANLVKRSSSSKKFFFSFFFFHSSLLSFPCKDASLESPVPSPLFGRKSPLPELSTADSEAEAKATLIAEGPLMVVEKKKVRSMQFSLSTATFSSDSGAKVWLREVSAITVGGCEQLQNCFGVVRGMDLDKQFFFGASSEEELREWVLLLSSACVAFGGSLGVLGHSLKVTMTAASIERYSGGILKREEIGEEWQYRKSGNLILQGKTSVHYAWNGTTLLPVKGANHGKGVFDGLMLMWYAPVGVALGYEKKKKKKKRSTKKKNDSVSPPLSRNSATSGDIAALETISETA
jgi:hypothetical protein